MNKLNMSNAEFIATLAAEYQASNAGFIASLAAEYQASNAGFIASPPQYDVSLVSLYETPVNNHGCRGFSVDLRIIDDRTAEVVSGSSCSSCWQVGHDSSDSPIEIGTIVRLPDWCASWEVASAPHGRSHNELVEDSEEEPQPDCSTVWPSELTAA